uniref:Ssu-2 homolog n=1 Tax=Oryctolagus cuniculus TaxID=9986 RepID=G1T7R7_RABIT
ASEMELSFEAESPLAPPAELLERLPGHDWLLPGDGQQVFFPPPETPGRPQEQRSWSWFLRYSRVPTVTEEVAREALLSFVSSKCCYGHAAAGDLVIRELKQQNLCRYRLETFSESRVSEWTFQPLTNQAVDGPQRGPSPRLWDIKVPAPPLFQEDTRKLQVPHSSLVKECHKCHGRGRYKCSGCHGAGRVSDSVCVCMTHSPAPPSGPFLCVPKVTIPNRLGPLPLPPQKGQRFEFVSDPPGSLHCGPFLGKPKGKNLFPRPGGWPPSLSQVYPIVDFPLPEIARASQRGIAEHSAALGSRARILKQVRRAWAGGFRD